MIKSKIRKEVLSLIRDLPEKELKSRVIGQRFLSLPQVTAASVVAVFMSMTTEPDTAPIICRLHQEGKKVVVPRVIGEEMEFVMIDESTPFFQGPYGISEPQGEAYTNKIDVMAVPLVAFDEDNFRLGHGKGYYDKYLSAHPCYTAGLAFSEQKRKVPRDVWDVPLNIIITD